MSPSQTERPGSIATGIAAGRATGMFTFTRTPAVRRCGEACGMAVAGRARRASAECRRRVV
jgi:hypothetical protein